MSTLSVDAITGKSTSTNITIGSTPVVSASANSLTIRGEGTAQTSIQQGLCKSWTTFDGTTTSAGQTITPTDSFNIGTITDNATADYSFTYSSNMRIAGHPVTASVIGSEVSNYYSFVTSDGVAQATTGNTIHMKHHAGSSDDQTPVHVVIHGDLA